MESKTIVHTIERFHWEITKIKDWLEFLLLLKKQDKTFALVIYKTHIEITIADENKEDAAKGVLHKNMMESFFCSKPTAVGISVSEWIRTIRYLKNKHVSLIRISGFHENHIKMEGQNSCTGHKVDKLLANINIDERIPYVSAIHAAPRVYPFFLEARSKIFHQDCREAENTSTWTRLTIDFCDQSLCIQGLSDNMISTSFPVTIIPNPLVSSPITAIPEYFKILKSSLGGGTYPPRLLKKIMNFVIDVPTISNVFSSQKILQYSFAHKINGFVRIYLAPEQELILEYVLRQCPTDMEQSSRLEAWIGYRMERQNSAVLQDTVSISCLDQVVTSSRLSKDKDMDNHKKQQQQQQQQEESLGKKRKNDATSEDTGDLVDNLIASKYGIIEDDE